jgi:tellurite resistance protein
MPGGETSSGSGTVRGRPRVPPNFFSIPFGLAGLGECWRAAAAIIGFSPVTANAIYILSAFVWLALVCRYLAQGVARVRADVRDPALSPFVALAVISPLIPAAALAPYAFTAARVLVIIFLAATLLVGGLLVGHWTAGGLREESVHPGYYLPTVAGGLIGAYAAQTIHLHAVAEAYFGIGIVFWLLIGSILLSRLFFRAPLPPLLVPALAIEVAPPVVAGIAYFALGGGPADLAARALAGVAAVFAVIQLSRLPRYVRLPFTPGFWAFTFSYSAVCLDALLWIEILRPAGAAVWTAVILALISTFIAAIAARTLLAAARGQFFPPANVPERQPDRNVPD